MSRKIVHVVGTGTIGEPLIGLLSDFKDKLGIDEITFHKNSPLTTDRSKVRNLMKRGARLTTHEEKFDGFNSLGLKPEFTTEQAIDRASVVIDCTPKGYGQKNKVDYYEKFLHNTKGFIAQGSEVGFGKMYARGINDEALNIEDDRFIQVVSCNTHNLCTIVKTLALSDGEENLVEGRFNLIRRSNDVSQSNKFVPAPQVGAHGDNVYGTHHAQDAAALFTTLNLDLDLFSSAMITNSQYMHILHFYLKVKEPTSIQKIISKLESNDKIAITDKINSNEVFSFGRDHGHFGRILNQTVVSIPTLNLKNETEITGFCFTPQDGNSLLSSIAATEWFLYNHSYEDKIQCLKPYFYDEV
jgi:glyceraldehyde-3-phosphate dehydrogenase type II|tara:strand:+ start:211 stop:1278 length:1068 start_codon:yes stop_codon:yes gene_type:complete